MRIAVTGGSGKLGGAILRDLVLNGHEVVNLGRTAPRAAGPCPFLKVELTDLSQTIQAFGSFETPFARLDAIVHMAGVPGFYYTTPAATFQNNFGGTYNVFAAAKMAGVKTIVWGSSESLYGLPYAPITGITPERQPGAEPHYLPIDEEHPLQPESEYALAKDLEEEVARQMCRRDPSLRMIALRISHVQDERDYEAFAGWQQDPCSRMWNAWSYIDAADAAQAVRLALAYEPLGFEAFNIASADTVMEIPTAELVARHFPGVPVRRPLEGNETLLAIDKARRLLGFNPEHPWRDRANGGSG